MLIHLIKRMQTIFSLLFYFFYFIIKVIFPQANHCLKYDLIFHRQKLHRLVSPTWFAFQVGNRFRLIRSTGPSISPHCYSNSKSRLCYSCHAASVCPSPSVLLYLSSGPSCIKRPPGLVTSSQSSRKSCRLRHVEFHNQICYVGSRRNITIFPIPPNHDASCATKQTPTRVGSNKASLTQDYPLKLDIRCKCNSASQVAKSVCQRPW
jgi:hypothetical protein